MPTLNVRETLDLLRILAQRGVARKFGDLRDEVEELGGRLAQAAQAPLGTDRNLVEMLPEFQRSAADVLRLSEQAEAGLGQLAGVFLQLGLEGEPLVRPEQEEVPPKLYIDVETGTVVEGRIAGRFPEGQILNAVAALAEAKAPISQSLLSRVVYGEKAAEKEPWLRSRFSVLNGRAEELGLPEVVDSPGKHVGYVLGPDYEVLGKKRTFYPQEASVQAEPLPIASEPVAERGKKRRPGLAETLGTQQFFYGATVTKRTGVGQTALDLMGELGVLREGVHFVKRGERDIRVYTPDAVALAEELAKFAKRKGQGRFTERLVRDAFRIPSEQALKNPYGENGPKTVDDAVEFFLLQTVATCLPSLRRTVHADILAGQDESLRLRMEELKGNVLASAEPENVGEKRRLAAATAFDLTANRRPFNFLLRERPGLALAGELIDHVRAIRPGLLKEFPEAIINPPSSVPHIGPDSRVNGSHRKGPLGDVR